MSWIQSILFEHSAMQAVVVLCLICAVGMVLGKIKIAGISLGVTFVFFVGIIAGHLGVSVDASMLDYAADFGLVLFVYALGLQVGPGFFSSLAHGGIKLNALGLALAVLSLLLAVGITFITPVNLPDMMGVFCGATTNTPALGGVQQTLAQLGIPSGTPALGCAVAYPLGVIGVILAIIFMRKFFIRPSDISAAPLHELPKPKITEFEVTNKGIVGKTVEDVARVFNCHFVISRLWRNGTVSIPTSGTKLEMHDRLLVVSAPEDVEPLHVIFGEQDKTDWNDAGVPLLAAPDLRLQFGDKIVVVGEQKAIDKIEPLIGNTVNTLDEPNLFAVFIGIVLGVALGAVPFHFPGVSVPVSLGLAGGPIIMGILVGTFGPRLHMITYTTASANLMLRAIGLALFLACLGLSSGADFFDSVFRAEGAMWIGIGAFLTVVPVVLLGLVAVKWMRMDFGTVTGMLCGSMANPMALDYANSTLPGDRPSVAYATVYPISMFARVILVQLVILILM